MLSLSRYMKWLLVSNLSTSFCSQSRHQLQFPGFTNRQLPCRNETWDPDGKRRPEKFWRRIFASFKIFNSNQFLGSVHKQFSISRKKVSIHENLKRITITNYGFCWIVTSIAVFIWMENILFLNLNAHFGFTMFASTYSVLRPTPIIANALTWSVFRALCLASFRNCVFKCRNLMLKQWIF